MFGMQDELNNHSQPESISTFVHYGGDRTNDPKVIASHDVVLTTYGVLTAAYKKVNYPEIPFTNKSPIISRILIVLYILAAAVIRLLNYSYEW